MRILKYAIIALILATNTVHAKTASDTALDYFNVLKQKDYRGAANFFDPNALESFRQMMSFINEMPAESQQAFFPAFFGPGANKESVSKLSDAEFFASFLRAIMAQAEAAGGLNFDGMEVLGEVKEGANVAHVVTRNRVSVGEIEIEAMEVVSFKKVGKDWKAMLSGKMKGLANQLRTAFNRRQ